MRQQIVVYDLVRVVQAVGRYRGGLTKQEHERCSLYEC